MLNVSILFSNISFPYTLLLLTRYSAQLSPQAPSHPTQPKGPAISADHVPPGPPDHDGHPGHPSIDCSRRGRSCRCKSTTRPIWWDPQCVVFKCIANALEGKTEAFRIWNSLALTNAFLHKTESYKVRRQVQAYIKSPPSTSISKHSSSQSSHRFSSLCTLPPLPFPLLSSPPKLKPPRCHRPWIHRHHENSTHKLVQALHAPTSQ